MARSAKSSRVIRLLIRRFAEVRHFFAGSRRGLRRASLLHRGSLKILRWTVPVPPPRLTIYQIGIASADMLVAGAVLYMLCPPVKGAT